MESSLTNAFIDSIRNLTERCVAQIEAEAKKFITVVKALHALPPQQQQPSTDIQNRVDRLERVVSDRVQKSISSIVEDLDELNERVNKLSSSEDAEAPWIYTPADYLTSSDINEVVHDVNPITEYIPELIHSDHDVIMTAPIPVTAPVAPAPVPESVPESIVVVAPPADSPQVDPVEEEETDSEDEEEALELEELVVNGTTYMKDPEENVYAIGKDGEIDDTPVGRWVEKKQAIKFYTKH